jgi:FKBP-type peptidyl-prolyl cis-trans isomerase
LKEPIDPGRLALRAELSTGELVQNPLTHLGQTAIAGLVVLTLAACDSGAPVEGIFAELGIDTTKIDATPAGNFIQVEAEGTGDVAVDGDAVFILYTGWLTDGTKFDSSYNSDPPRAFPLVMGQPGAIPGFQEATAGMKLGEKRTVVIPPEQGYGEQGTPGGPIPPNAHLIFQVEAQRIEKPGDPRDVEFNPDLGIDLDAMTMSESGLYWTTLREGSGQPTAAGDHMAVHYTGKLADGTVFDSSVDQDPLPMVLQETALIAGWTEGVTGMSLGEKRLLVIPPALGYGFSGSPGAIPPNATLIFEVELAEHTPTGG